MPTATAAHTLLSAVARPADGGLRHAVEVDGRHTLFTDEPESLGGTDTAPAPHELLPAALASCISTMLMIYARTKGWDLDGLEVAVDYDPRSVPRRFGIEITVPGRLRPGDLERLRRVASTCPLRRALETGFEFDERFVLTGGSDG
jgi:putative redox protein